VNKTLEWLVRKIIDRLHCNATYRPYFSIIDYNTSYKRKISSLMLCFYKEF